jgi:hypothetical protein
MGIQLIGSKILSGRHILTFVYRGNSRAKAKQVLANYRSRGYEATAFGPNPLTGGYEYNVAVRKPKARKTK